MVFLFALPPYLPNAQPPDCAFLVPFESRWTGPDRSFSCARSFHCLCFFPRKSFSDEDLTYSKKVISSILMDFPLDLMFFPSNLPMLCDRSFFFPPLTDSLQKLIFPLITSRCVRTFQRLEGQGWKSQKKIQSFRPFHFFLGGLVPCVECFSESWSPLT